MTTHRALLTMVAASELLLRESGRRSNVMVSRTYVPGSAIRGHLAARWIARHGAPNEGDEAFHRLFDAADVRFRHAYPALGPDQTAPSVPAPFTVRTCKTHKLVGEHLARSTVADDGIPACMHASHRSDSDPSGIGGATRRVKGFVTPDAKVVAPSGIQEVRTRIGTDDHGFGVAADGQLFTEVRIGAGTAFVGEIVASEDVLNDLLDLLVDNDIDPRSLDGTQSTDASPFITVGRARSVMGRLSVMRASVDPVEASRTKDGDTHTLTFLSDTAVIDKGEAPVGLVDTDTFVAFLRAAGDEELKEHKELKGLVDKIVGGDIDVEVLSGSQVRRATIGGWDARTHKPKDLLAAVASGSTVRFRGSELAMALAKISHLGERRQEGYGHIAVDHPVHDHGQLAPAPSAPQAETKTTSSLELDEATRHQIAAKAKEAAGSIGGTRASRTLWQGIEATLRADRRLTPASELKEALEAERAAAHDPVQGERMSASGAGAGRAQRQRRYEVLAIFEEATAAALTGLDPDSAHYRVGRMTLADDVGRELDLLAATGKADR